MSRFASYAFRAFFMAARLGSVVWPARSRTLPESAAADAVVRKTVVQMVRLGTGRGEGDRQGRLSHGSFGRDLVAPDRRPASAFPTFCWPINAKKRIPRQRAADSEDTRAVRCAESAALDEDDS